ncbi:hypothetical protein COI83_26800 [Bacillus cereus]|nr:hypothetical protein COI83_26800 [Bacillus cereus]
MYNLEKNTIILSIRYIIWEEERCLLENLYTNKNFLLYFTGTFVSKIGDKLYLIAMPLLIYQLTQSSISLGTMFLVESLPFLFIPLFAGTIVDKVCIKKVLITASVIQAILISLIIFLKLLHQLEIWHIYLIGFMLSSVVATFQVANETIIPLIFQKHHLVRVNTIAQFIDTLTLLLGTGAAGVLVTSIGIYGVLLIDVFSFIIIPFTFIFIKIISNNYNNKNNYYNVRKSYQEIKEGFKYIKNHAIMRPIAVMILIGNVSNSAYMSMLVFFSVEYISLNTEQIGFIYSFSAVIQIITVMLIPRITRAGATVKLMLFALIINALSFVWISISINWITLIIGSVIQSSPIILFNVLNRTLRQNIIPNQIFGKINGIFLMISKTVFPLSGFLAGLLASYVSLRILFCSLGLVTLFMTLYFLSRPISDVIIITEEKNNVPMEN